MQHFFDESISLFSGFYVTFW